MIMDEFDAPRRMPSENSEKVPDLEELQRQTCQLFEEFLLLEDSFCPILEEPSSATYYGGKEVADSPIETFYKQKTSSKRGLVLCASSLDDDVVPDSMGSTLASDVASDAEVSHPIPTSVRHPIEQEEKQETEKDNKMKKLAFELAKAGDALVSEYGSDVKDVEGKLIQLVQQEAHNLTYERFSTAIDNLVGQDKNWTNFVFAFCVGKRIMKHSNELFTYAKGHFQQYVQSYSTTIQETGDLETFVYKQGNPMPQ